MFTLPLVDSVVSSDCAFCYLAGKFEVWWNMKKVMSSYDFHVQSWDKTHLTYENKQPIFVDHRNRALRIDMFWTQLELGHPKTWVCFAGGSSFSQHTNPTFSGWCRIFPGTRILSKSKKSLVTVWWLPLLWHQREDRPVQACIFSMWTAFGIPVKGQKGMYWKLLKVLCIIGSLRCIFMLISEI